MTENDTRHNDTIRMNTWWTVIDFRQNNIHGFINLLIFAVILLNSKAIITMYEYHHWAEDEYDDFPFGRTIKKIEKSFGKFPKKRYNNVSNVGQ